MNVPLTQPTLTLVTEVAALVALQEQAADQLQRQQALSAQREAAHAAASVAQAEGATESSVVAERRERTNRERRPQGRGLKEKVDEAPVKDAIDPGPLGHRLDIIA